MLGIVAAGGIDIKHDMPVDGMLVTEHTTRMPRRMRNGRR